MSDEVAVAMKKGRLAAGLSLHEAAESLHLEGARHLSRYEAPGGVKLKNSHIIAEAIKLYGDETIGYAFIEQDPVFIELAGTRIPRMDLKAAAMTAWCENDEDREILLEIMRWAASGGVGTLSEKCIEEVRDTFMANLVLFNAIVRHKKEAAPVAPGSDSTRK